MKQTDRIVIFIIGFTIGTFLVSVYFENKSLKKEQAEEEILSAWSELGEGVRNYQITTRCFFKRKFNGIGHINECEWRAGEYLDYGI